MRAIDIDVGGTFTDLVLTWDGERITAKAPTTPYDLSVGFLDVLTDGAEQIGKSIDELLPDVELVRYSTTVAMNRLIERKGPRLGLLTTEGHEDAILIGRGAQWARRHPDLRAAQPRGAEQARPAGHPRHDRRRPRARGLLRRGAASPRRGRRAAQAAHARRRRRAGDRGVAALDFANPAHERRIREIIREEYRSYHVGYLPVVLSHEVVAKVGEYERTMTAILDAYLQSSHQDRTGDDLGPAARARLPRQFPAHPQHRRVARRSSRPPLPGPTTAARSPG